MNEYPLYSGDPTNRIFVEECVEDLISTQEGRDKLLMRMNGELGLLESWHIMDKVRLDEDFNDQYFIVRLQDYIDSFHKVYKN